MALTNETTVMEIAQIAVSGDWKTAEDFQLFRDLCKVTNMIRQRADEDLKVRKAVGDKNAQGIDFLRKPRTVSEDAAEKVDPLLAAFGG